MNRYQKQLILKDFGAEGQEKLKKARILIVGLGGLGTPAAQYLNAMGVGTLGLIDGDRIAFSNLHRQVLYDENDVGKSKVAVAASKLQSQNPKTTLEAYEHHLEPENAREICGKYDLIVDASDNFGTRYLVNDISVILDIPFVYGALHGWEGQLSVFNYNEGPTYRCIFPNPPALGQIPDCDTYGVLGVLPGILGAMQGLEAVKICLNLDEVITGKLLLYNGLYNTMETILLPERQQENQPEDLLKDYRIVCPSTSYVSSSAFTKMLEEGAVLQVIDVRSATEYSRDHLPGAVNLPMDRLEQRYAEYKWDTSTYLICQSGTRSRLAQYKLKAQLGVEIPFVQGGLNELSALCS